ncbi:hypothetical protein Pmar_PMAR003266 [Perkinsus marinus ATCC 50983]|uniref:Uncharacterized protein n=1 Tax=Perkinsus marinus (strain ATCC 50983 / TXsc) TaxID=423536 RepID=C5L5P9_PERM5|nr:hypothetical protein Pmar_PMAR003266 [Perkinsus marinus ATCC 50983]EER07946.1 hypothetical protein Pmar_PMAR003266 [Perkinsus marinus ATCC 50983]|eukprot:XP_002776130.1 hypothetical protein Pmar_PMAR003266 [Perkinsus marinus ATCC 50983]
MSLMKPCAYIFACVIVGQLTEAVVLHEQMTLEYPPNQLYGPVLADKTCPTVNGTGQYPGVYSKDPRYSVCMPIVPVAMECPSAPAKGEPVHDGNLPLCLIPCETGADCQEGAVCLNTGKTKLCAFFNAHG